MAPEVLAGHPATSASDMYSLGMTLSVAAEGMVDGPLADVLSALVDPRPARRPSADEAVRLLAPVAGDEHPETGPGELVPRQIPAPRRDFVGRDAELAALTRFADESTVDDGPVVISTVAGGGGIGKTALAVQWAARVADRFPDGQLYLNLRGFDLSGSPMSPAEALRTLLDAFQVPAERIPAGLEAQAGLYRSLIAGRRMLLLLDNARDSDQVRPLLPGTSGCLVLVTSRNRLTGLITGHGARHLPVDVLPDTQARALLSARLGADRVAGEPAATAEVLAHCGGIPLALSIVAGRVQTNPHISLATVADDLREARLTALEDDDPAISLPAVLSWSYAALTPEQTRVLGLLAIAPGPDISLRAAANLAALPTTRTRAVLRGLAQVSLIDQDAAGRYRMHDLVRHHAAGQAGDQDAALRRLAAFYLHTANTGDRLLPAPRQPIELDLPTPEEPHPLTDESAAVAWFTIEHRCLLATQELAVSEGWHDVVWQLAWALGNFHRRQGHLHDDIAVWQAGCAAANRLDDPFIKAVAHRRLGRAMARTGRHDEAFDHLRQALTWAEHANDLDGQAHVHQTLSWTWGQRGDDRRALEHATRALHLFRRLDNPVWEAVALNAVGWCHARLGEYGEGRQHCEAALAVLSRHPNVVIEAVVLDSLGYIAHHNGEHTQAVEYYQRALAGRHDHDTYERANNLRSLGHPLVALGRHEQAREVWQQALELFEAQHLTAEADTVRRLLADL
jgi:tetratricopeptide (TPR) repeat protein